MKKVFKSEYDLAKSLDALLNLFAQKGATTLEKFGVKKPPKLTVEKILGKYMIYDIC